MTPPYPLILTEAGPEEQECLIEGLRERGLKLPRVMGPANTAAGFVAMWSRGNGQSYDRRQSLRIFQVNEVTPGPFAPGRLEVLSERDRDQAIRWSAAFEEEAHLAVRRDAEKVVGGYLERGEGYLWVDGAPVSMAVATSPTLHGVRIGGVYTPSEYRCHGYATALVGALSARMLQRGHSFCFLFTDLSNPISNSIYPKVGYRPVCDFAVYQAE